MKKLQIQNILPSALKISISENVFQMLRAEQISKILIKKFYRNIKFNFPLSPHNKKIASILSAYDNLIQNYKKQIEALQTQISRLIQLFWRIKNLNKQITNLTQQRDLLLPRLMSGKLEV